MNPCIDCRIHMFSHAGKELMEEYEAHFLVTGEVMGQRPMTQMKKKLRLIEREAGLEGLIVRPLCQAALWRTIPEQKGWIDTEKLMSITGRGRKPQIQLAKDLGVVDYPQPAGGCCFLTDGNYGKRLKDTIEHRGKEELDFEDVLVLKLGRHFRLPENNKLIVGRNHEENEMLKGHWNMGKFLRVKGWNGPLSLYIGDIASSDFRLAMEITARYSDCPAETVVPVEVMHQDDVQDVSSVTATPRGDEASWMIH